jgi:hypothetical protein
MAHSPSQSLALRAELRAALGAATSQQLAALAGGCGWAFALTTNDPNANVEAYLGALKKAGAPPVAVLANGERVHLARVGAALAAATPGRTFVDLNPALVDANGHPRLDLYVADKLHFHPPAYVAFTAILKPVLARVWAEANGVP